MSLEAAHSANSCTTSRTKRTRVSTAVDTRNRPIRGSLYKRGSESYRGGLSFAFEYVTAQCDGITSCCHSCAPHSVAIQRIPVNRSRILDVKTGYMVRLCWAIGAPWLLLPLTATSCKRLSGSAASEARAERMLLSLHPGWYPITDTDKTTGEIKERTQVIGQGADASRQAQSDDPMPLLQLECRAPRKGAPAFDVAFLSVIDPLGGTADAPSDFIVRFDGDSSPRRVHPRWRDPGHMSVYLGPAEFGLAMQGSKAMLVNYTTASDAKETVRFDIDGVSAALRGLTHCPLDP